MKIHRTRKCSSIDDNPKDHLFVEMKKNKWLEVGKIPTHEAIHSELKKEEKAHQHSIMIAERYFRIGGIKNWIVSSPIS